MCVLGQSCANHLDVVSANPTRKVCFYHTTHIVYCYFLLSWLVCVSINFIFVSLLPVCPVCMCCVCVCVCICCVCVCVRVCVLCIYICVCVVCCGRLMEDLTAAVALSASNPSMKNVSILLKASALCRRMSGCMGIICKSGKDRTAMGTTLEHGRALVENCGIANGVQTVSIAAPPSVQNSIMKYFMYWFVYASGRFVLCENMAGDVWMCMLTLVSRCLPSTNFNTKCYLLVINRQRAQSAQKLLRNIIL